MLRTYAAAVHTGLLVLWKQVFLALPHTHVKLSCGVFTLNRSFYSTTSIHPVVLSSHETALSTQRHQYTQCPCWFFILEIQILWSQTVRQRKNKTTTINQGKASEMLAYLVREHNKTSQTRKIRKIRTKKTKKADRTTYVLKRNT